MGPGARRGERLRTRSEKSDEGTDTSPGLPRPPAARVAGSAARVHVRRAGIELFLAAFLVLFLELVLIRWLPTQVRVVAYFPNLVLVAAFLGLGVGCLRARARPLMGAWPWLLVLLVAAAGAMSRVAFTAEGISEHLWLLYEDLPAGAPVVHGLRAPLLGVFVLTAAVFVAPGQLVARRLEIFRRHATALRGYAVDLLGSLGGIGAFALLSLERTPPEAWFLVVLAVAAVLVLRRPRARLGFLAAAGLAVLGVTWASGADDYSPYYALRVEELEEGEGYRLLTNGSLHQMAWSVDPAAPAVSARHDKHRRGLRLPLRLLREPPDRALVLGAGTGNDVAALLDAGARGVDAVEIDPVILETGRELHPDRPYASPRVRTVATDARSFLENTDRRYDLIVYGTLDSQTRLSALAGVRLDDFVYTREGLRAARERLRPGGGVILYFWVERDFVADHLAALLTETFGEPPLVHRGPYGMLNAIYLAGPLFRRSAGVGPNGTTADDGAESGPRLRTAKASASRAVPTDDWPYLYLPDRGVGSFYRRLLAAALLIAAVAVSAATPTGWKLLTTDVRHLPGVARALLSGHRESRAVDLEMFLYGAGFLLVEARLVSFLHLAWGSTWLASAVVFASVLLTVLLATLHTEIRGVSFRLAAAGLVVTLAVTSVLSPGLLVGRPWPVRLALSALTVGLPVYFASLCFADRFRARRAADAAFGWNLLGAVSGGLLEFLGMATGLGALALVALALYVGAFAVHRWTADAPERAVTRARQRATVS